MLMHMICLDLKRHDEKEIRPLFKGRGNEAINNPILKEYLLGLNNLKKYFVSDYNVLLVANDRKAIYIPK